jgi:hypothetical protein
MPHTVRRRVCAIRPTSRPTKVGNVGAVEHDRARAAIAEYLTADHGPVAAIVRRPLHRMVQELTDFT